MRIPRARVLLLAPLMAAGAALIAAGDATTSRTHAELVAATDAWHEGRIRRLTAPDGWLTLVALEPLAPGPNRVGRSPDAEVSYAGFPFDSVGTITVEADQVRFTPDPGVTVEGVPADAVLRTDADGEPTVLSIGDIRFHIIARGDTLAVRIKDANAPTRTSFKGIDRFPVSEAWRITAEFVPAAKGEQIRIDTVIGVEVDAEISGHAKFRHDGAQVNAVLFDAGNGASLLRFADATSGDTTYSIGRYLYVEPSADGKTVTLDFNRAYNPPCALTPYATCTLPPPSNDFPFSVTAGEQWSESAEPAR